MSVAPEVQARTVTLDVRGVPRPQGSMQLFKNGGAKYSDGVYVWRGTLTRAVVQLDVEAFVGPVELRLGFDMPRLGEHFLPVNTKRTERELRANAPRWPTVAPDLDKLVRCVCDSITDGGLWHDDAQVASLIAAKRYGDLPGVRITITEMT